MLDVYCLSIGQKMDVLATIITALLYSKAGIWEVQEVFPYIVVLIFQQPSL